MSWNINGNCKSRIAKKVIQRDEFFRIILFRMFPSLSNPPLIFLSHSHERIRLSPPLLFTRLLQEKNDSVAAMNDEITQEVGEAMPALEATEKAVKALDKKDLVEVRVLNKPPDLVLAVMEPICILLNVK